MSKSANEEIARGCFNGARFKSAACNSTVGTRAERPSARATETETETVNVSVEARMAAKASKAVSRGNHAPDKCLIAHSLGASRNTALLSTSGLRCFSSALRSCSHCAAITRC